MEVPDNPDFAAAMQLTEFNIQFGRVARHILYVDADGGYHGRLESDPEHSYKLADLALALAPRLNPGLDLVRVLEYALHHDKIENIVGDTSVWASAEMLDSKAQREADGMPALELALSLHPRITEIAHRYHARADAESRFVFALDKIEAILTIIYNRGLTWQDGSITAAMHQEKRVGLRKKVAQAPELLPLFDEIAAYLDAHPELFAQSAD
ncbi:HD domain-containing protein [Candidatus Microgenomates bacterium]|nr:HD domain-containing protein [Candidatus Microgenomates bacterium]